MAALPRRGSKSSARARRSWWRAAACHPGVPSDFYARLAQLARRLGSRLVLDTSGEPLAQAVAEGVYLLKPSLREFRILTDSPGGDDAELAALAAAAVRKRGWCEVLVLSLGAGGALWVDAARARAPRGAGGTGQEHRRRRRQHGRRASCVALAGGRSVGDAVRFGVAAGAAAVMNPGTELCHRADVDRLLPQVTAAGC